MCPFCQKENKKEEGKKNQNTEKPIYKMLIAENIVYLLIFLLIKLNARHMYFKVQV